MKCLKRRAWLAASACAVASLLASAALAATPGPRSPVLIEAYGDSTTLGITCRDGHCGPQALNAVSYLQDELQARHGEQVRVTNYGVGNTMATQLRDGTGNRRAGIGAYTEEDFARAMREGVAKDGHNLYPAMPYPSYAKINDDDMKALYAFFMSGVAPVQQANREPDIKWPLNMRWPLKFWNMAFLEKGAYQDKPGKDAAWNRGAYLIQGLGHCGSCHTPRGVAFQEKALDESGSEFLTGGLLDGWFAANLTGAHNVGLGRWNDQDLQAFLKTGANRHASAFGSMTSVINNSTQYMSDADNAAMTTYLKSLPPAGSSGAPPYTFDPQATKVSLNRPANDAGARVYTAYCMHCHGVDGRGFAPMLAPLAGNPNVLDKDASSLINVTLNGTEDLVVGGVPAPYPMPKFAPVLDDQQIADVLTFVRAGWNNGAPAVTAAEVAKLRKSTQAAR